MRSGISFPSVASLATFAPVTGGQWSTSPAGVLNDLRSPRRQAVANTAAAATDITFVLPSKQNINFLALIHHNAPAGAQMRLYLFNDNNPDPVGNAGAILYDSGALDVWAGVAAGPDALFPATFPLLLPAIYFARSGYIKLLGRSALDNTPWQLGAVEISQFYQWSDVTVPREIGIAEAAQKLSVSANLDHVSAQWAPRVVRGSRGLLDKSELEGKVLDFQIEKGRDLPFVWIWDYDDATTWPQQCVLVVNDSLTTTTVGDADVGTFGFDLREHLG